MKSLLRLLPLVCGLALLVPARAGAQDLRDAYRQAESGREAATARAAEKEEVILANRVRLESAVIQLEAELEQVERDLAASTAHLTRQTSREEELTRAWDEHELDFREISGNVRLAARDLETMLHQSHFTALYPDRVERISPLLDKGYFPDIDDISGLANVIFTEISLAGQVGLHDGDFIGRDGSEVTGRILTLGRFTAAYEREGEVGFLSWSPESGRFYALTGLPRGGIGRDLRGFLNGKSDVVPLDMSGGNALRQITHQTSLPDQLQAGGPIVWPIVGLAIVALLIVIVRVIHLNRIHANTDHFMGEVNGFAARGDWAAAEDLVERHRKRHSPVLAVIKSGLAARRQERETQESVLQEAILREMPRVESGLSVLAILGAVAPLLGLLGTVTGMINTFRVITLFGTSDPKLMSGGISEALVTTELGLMVAIPIMLAHTFLSRRADHIVGDMEEKAVQLVNIIQIRKEDQALVAATAGGGLS
jgi:biopolymer transport protein ExbB